MRDGAGDTGFWSISNGAVTGWHDLGDSGLGYGISNVGLPSLTLGDTALSGNPPLLGPGDPGGLHKA